MIDDAVRHCSCAESGEVNPTTRGETGRKRAGTARAMPCVGQVVADVAARQSERAFEETPDPTASGAAAGAGSRRTAVASFPSITLDVTVTLPLMRL